MPYDHSQLHTFQTCPEKYRLTFLERLERVTDTPENQPLRFGQALHAGLASWYRPPSPPSPTPSLTLPTPPERLGAVEEAFLTVFPKALGEGEKLYTPQHGLQVLQHYLQQYGEADKSYKVLAVESPITLLLSNSLEYLVKLDTVVEDANGVWVLEHKSTASNRAFTDKWWEQFEPNSQLSGQVAACQQQYGRCDGIILNGIAFSYGVRKGFTVECQRQVFQRTAEQVEDWKQNVVKVIGRVQQHLSLNGTPWEKHEAMCAWCSYRPLCISCGAEGVREAMYRQVTPEQVYAYQGGE